MVKRRFLNLEEGEEGYSYSCVYDEVMDSLLEDRKIFISEDFTIEMSTRIVSTLIYLDGLANTPITIYINSSGGEVEAMFAIYDTMNIIKSPIRTICIGEAASCAAIILAAGSPGMRQASANSRIMIHQIRVEGGMDITGTDVEIEAKNIKSLKKSLNEIIARHTGQIYKKVYKDCELDKYMTAEDARKYGIIDEILVPTKVIPELKNGKPRNKST